MDQLKNTKRFVWSLCGAQAIILSDISREAKPSSVLRRVSSTSTRVICSLAKAVSGISVFHRTKAHTPAIPSATSTYAEGVLAAPPWVTRFRYSMATPILRQSNATDAEAFCPKKARTQATPAALSASSMLATIVSQ